VAENAAAARKYIKCMALVESHPLAFQMEEFLYNLRGHILGLNLGRWDYMASLIHFQICAIQVGAPDRNTIPHNVPFFSKSPRVDAGSLSQAGNVGHRWNDGAIPSREDAETEYARALAALEKDKKNEADSLMDGAWTGHPDQNQIALDQFPFPNQLHGAGPQADAIRICVRHRPVWERGRSAGLGRQ